MFKLVIQDDEGKTTVVPLIRDELTIGRKEGNTIRLTERNVSRRHARVMRHNGSITIEDLDSYNGIRVNGSRINGKIKLKESDRVQIGDYLIEIKSEAARDQMNEATQPMERVDPMGNTPVPEVTALSTAVTVPTAVPIEMDNLPTQPVTPVPEVKAAAPKAAEPEPPAVAQAQPAAQPVGHARLVVLSTNYAGRDFELDKPAMVIGRTDDNDIWLNHRSISRHHAKIVRENGRYAIVDLQSSNGVRVNGEEYGKVELRRADVIDLGHVRMRFVEPGEDFLFGRDAQAIEIEGERGGRGALWAVLALLVLAAAGGVYWMTIHDDKSSAPDDQKASSANVEPTPAPSEAVVPPPPAVPDAAPVVAVETPPAAEGVASHLRAAEQAIKTEKWAAAHEEANKALELEPSNARALDLARQAKGELASELSYGDFEKCPRTNYRCIIDTFEKIDPLSVYRDKAQPKWNAAREQFIRERVAAAKKLASRGKCDDLRKLATSSAAYWPEAKDSVAAVRCDSSSSDASVKPPPVETEVKPPPVEGEGTEVVSSAEDEKEADAALKEAQAAAKSSDYSKALTLCEKSLRLKKSQEATVVCAIAACNLRRSAEASKYLARIRSAATRESIRKNVCLKNGLDLAK